MDGGCCCAVVPISSEANRYGLWEVNPSHAAGDGRLALRTILVDEPLVASLARDEVHAGRVEAVHVVFGAHHAQVSVLLVLDLPLRTRRGRRDCLDLHLLESLLLL